jgi:hypothetical protein
MGLLDNLENMAVSKVAGSNPEAAGVLEMIQNHPGGLDGLVQAFHANGMSGLVNSWVSTGATNRFLPRKSSRCWDQRRCRPSRRSWACRRKQPAPPSLKCCPRSSTSSHPMAQCQIGRTCCRWARAFFRASARRAASGNSSGGARRRSRPCLLRQCLQNIGSIASSSRQIQWRGKLHSGHALWKDCVPYHRGG